jgi:hypothetical protein
MFAGFHGGELDFGLRAIFATYRIEYVNVINDLINPRGPGIARLGALGEG